MDTKLLLPAHARSKIYVPERGEKIVPEDWDGSVAIHAPLRQAFFDLEWEKQQRRESRKLATELGLHLPLIAGAAAGAWLFPNSMRTDLMNGTFDIDSDTWKMALFLSTSNLGAASTTYAGVTNEHAAANGYSTGGAAIALTMSGTTTVIVDITTDPVWTASGGSITARFAAIYEVGGRVLVYCLLDAAPADVTATDGNTFTVAANAGGVYTLA